MRAVERLKKMEGEQGLMLFAIYVHSSLLGIYGGSREAKQYVLGNPLIASSMTRHEIRAGLYAPLRIYVYEKDAGRTIVEFDQASSLLGQFGHPEVNVVAQALDSKLRQLIEKAAHLSM